MSKHTPGPWKVDKRERETLITAPTMPYIAAVSSSLHGQPGTGEANARLVAAAPELLGLLKTAIIYTSVPNHTGSIDKKGKADPLWKNTCACEVHEWFKAAFATIAKAEGDE